MLLSEIGASGCALRMWTASEAEEMPTTASHSGHTCGSGRVRFTCSNMLLGMVVILTEEEHCRWLIREAARDGHQSRALRAHL